MSKKKCVPEVVFSPVSAVAVVAALKTVSFYARINHGDKARDYGKIVDPVLKMLGVPTGQL